MKNQQRAGKDPAVEAALAKLAPEDRAVVEGALERAERTEAELRFLADHDSLTGLLNRRRFRAELDQYVSFTARYGGRGAVMVIDIDGVKDVNDRPCPQGRGPPLPPGFRAGGGGGGAAHIVPRPPRRG